MKTLNASLIIEKNKLEGTTPIRLFEIQYADSSASKLHFAAYNEDISYFLPNTATAQTYTKAPIEVSNIEYTTVDNSPRVNISLSNVDRTIGEYLLSYDGLRGRPITIVRTFKSLLGNSNACIVEKYYIDSAQISLNDAQFNLVPRATVQGAQLPKRVYRRSQCSFKFKSLNCAGSSTLSTPTVNASIASSLITSCSKTLASCLQYNNLGRYGGFPGIPQKRVVFA